MHDKLLRGFLLTKIFDLLIKGQFIALDHIVDEAVKLNKFKEENRFAVFCLVVDSLHKLMKEKQIWSSIKRKNKYWFAKRFSDEREKPKPPKQPKKYNQIGYPLRIEDQEIE